MQDTDAEGGSLAAAGLGLRNQVAPFEKLRQALRLDGSHVAIAEIVEVAQQRGR